MREKREGREKKIENEIDVNKKLKTNIQTNKRTREAKNVGPIAIRMGIILRMM